ncbi:18769_t:CDS:2, partial [Acaulospora morrowiae]
NTVFVSFKQVTTSSSPSSLSHTQASLSINNQKSNIQTNLNDFFLYQERNNLAPNIRETIARKFNLEKIYNAPSYPSPNTPVQDDDLENSTLYSPPVPNKKTTSSQIPKKIPSSSPLPIDQQITNISNLAPISNVIPASHAISAAPESTNTVSASSNVAPIPNDLQSTVAMSNNYDKSGSTIRPTSPCSDNDISMVSLDQPISIGNSSSLAEFNRQVQEKLVNIQENIPLIEATQQIQTLIKQAEINFQMRQT